MNKVRDSTQSSGKNSKLNPSVVEKEMDDFLSDNQLSAHSTYAAGTQSSVAMITGLTAACAGAGWRRYLQEVRVNPRNILWSIIHLKMNF